MRSSVHPSVVARYSLSQHGNPEALTLRSALFFMLTMLQATAQSIAHVWKIIPHLRDRSLGALICDPLMLVYCRRPPHDIFQPGL